MIRYNKKWLDNLLIKKEAGRFFNHKWISENKLAEIRAHYSEDFISHRFFTRLGVYSFTLLSAAATIGLIGTIFSLNESNTLWIMFSLLVFLALFAMIQSGHYKSGLDDALLHLGLFLFGLGISANFFEPRLAANSLFLGVLIAGVVLFSDKLVAISSWLAFISLLLFYTIRMGGGEKTITLLMLVSGAALYYLSARLLKKENLRYWEEPLVVCRIMALLTLYAGAAGLKISDGGLFGLSGEYTSHSIPKAETVADHLYAWVMYAGTLLLPLGYFGRSLLKKDRILLITGLVTLFHSLFTKLIPHLSYEYLLLFSGLAMAGLAWLAIRFLAENRFGLIYRDDGERALVDEEAGNVLQTNILSSTTSSIAGQKPADGFKGGGGKFGGGGADGSF